MISCLKFNLLFLIFLSVASLLFSCAEVAGPPGGPRDETAPAITSTIPLSNNVNTLINNKITISFSEQIERKTVKGAIFITPRPDGEVEYSWKKNSLVIILLDPFKENTTYVVTVGATIRDLRGNRLEESYSFAFSTGETIDEGSIGGYIFQENKPASGITIALYDYSMVDSFLFLDSLYPPYLTQSGKNGEFEFNYLPDGKYLVLAYSDKNKNQLLNYPSEMFGLTDRFVIIDEMKQYPALNINMTSKDTTSLSIISTTISTDNLIKVRLSKNISCESVFENLAQVHLISLDRQNTIIPATSVRESSGGEVAVFNFHFANLSDGLYKFRIGERLVIDTGNNSTYIESSEFSVQLKPDSTGPQLDFFSHNQKRIFPDENSFEFGFSEPMNQNKNTDSSILIYDSDDNRKDVSFSWIDDFRLGLIPDNLEWGKGYFVVLNEKEFSDLSGNNLGDSISVFKYYTYDSDSLGEASGMVKYGSQFDSGSVSYITFRDVSGKKQFTKKINNHRFNFQLSPGKYLLSGFIDSNNNGVYDSGSLIPFKFAETMAFAADTIRVRARFETAGLVFEFK